MMALNPAFVEAAGVKRQSIRGVVAISGVYRLVIAACLRVPLAAGVGGICSIHVMGGSARRSMERLAANRFARLAYMHSVFGGDADAWAEMFPGACLCACACVRVCLCVCIRACVCACVGVPQLAGCMKTTR
jgi:hypothetical protein